MINKEIEILMEDSFLIAVRKPAGIASESGRIGEADMVSLVKNYLSKKGESTYLAMIMRLDQPVEGILLFAKRKDAAAQLSKDLQNGIIKKTYTAAVASEKPLPEGEVTLVDQLIREKGSNLSRVAGAEEKNNKDAKRAELSYKLTDSLADGRYILSIKLKTGRHHQIRLQLSNAGMPIIGDRKYGTVPPGYRGPLCLACSRLDFLHPKSKKNISLQIKPDYLTKV